MSRDFVPIDLSRMGLIANYLERMALADRFYGERDVAWQGEPGSQARSERAYPGPSPAAFSWMPRLIDTTFAAARVCLTAVAEQALAIGRLITDPSIGVGGVLGVEVCCRSAVEIGARGWWLLDPSIGAHQRASRFLVDQLYSARQAERLVAAMGWNGTVRDHGISPTVLELEAKVAELGLTTTWRRDDPSVDGEQRPSATDMITELVGSTIYRDSAPMVYRLLSATTHGTIYGLMRSFRPIDETYQGLSMLGRMADHRVVESTAGVAMMSFLAILERAVVLMGWDHWKCTSLTNMTASLLRSGPA